MSSKVDSTCECGLNYVRGSEEDEKYHVWVHAEYARGPRINWLGRLLPLAEARGFAFHVIDSSVPIEARRKLAHVAMVAQRSIRGPAGYYGTVSEEDQRLFLLADKSNAIAMAITALDLYFWKLRWTSRKSIELVDQQVLSRSGPKIARVWVAADYRRYGLATLLTIEVAKHLGIDVAELGWELPFTESGAALVQKFAPAAFLGCCDGFTLREVLSKRESG